MNRTNLTPADLYTQLTQYKSHKIVAAGNITRIATVFGGGLELSVRTSEGKTFAIQESAAWAQRNPTVVQGGYYVVYQDGYASFSPKKAFEEGYTEHAAEPSALVQRLRPDPQGKMSEDDFLALINHLINVVKRQVAVGNAGVSLKIITESLLIAARIGVQGHGGVIEEVNARTIAALMESLQKEPIKADGKEIRRTKEAALQSWVRQEMSKYVERDRLGPNDVTSIIQTAEMVYSRMPVDSTVQLDEETGVKEDFLVILTNMIPSCVKQQFGFDSVAFCRTEAKRIFADRVLGQRELQTLFLATPEKWNAMNLWAPLRLAPAQENELKNDLNELVIALVTK